MLSARVDSALSRPQDERSSAKTTAWMAAGACRDADPSVFFPNDGVGVEVARTICKRCSVRAQCLDYAIALHIEHGVWGGTSERARRRVAQARRRQSS